MEIRKKGLSGKGLAKSGSGYRATVENDDLKMDEFTLKREEAKRIAQEKTRAKTLAKQQQIAERIATATEQLSSGIEESSGAAEELNRSMEQIASGAEEASSASEESRAAIVQIEKNAQVNATLSADILSKVNQLKALVGETITGVDSVIAGVNTSADAALDTARLMVQLERQSEEIGNIVQAVVRIADQTNLLALNAAIEAARAGEQGRGFAVVADEVRNLAEISERSAREIKDVVAEIQSSVRNVVAEINNIGKNAKDESEKGKKISVDLATIGASMDKFQKISREMEGGVQKILGESKDFLKMAEAVATASEELTSSAEESRKGTEQQIKAFSEMTTAAQDLAQTAEELKNSTDVQKSAEELASMSEQLSANVEEATSASQELAKAIEQISTATGIQSKEASNGMQMSDSIATVARQVEGNSTDMLKQSESIKVILGENKTGVDQFIINITRAGNENLKAAENIRQLDEKTQKIDKIVEAIMNVTIQTNMLAVSGSIEAARAGEHGRGFSVVAGDIRNLATESAENADKIKDLVRSLQFQVSKNTQDVELAARTALSETERAKISSSNLIKIENDMLVVGKSMDEILQNARESLSAIEQSKKGVDQIGAAAEEAAKSVSQAASAAEEQAKGLQELSQAIEEISSLADELQSN